MTAAATRPDPGTVRAALAAIALAQIRAGLAAGRALPAITVRQPYCWALTAGHKPVENRGQPLPARYVGRWVALHAGRTWSVAGGDDPRITAAAIAAYGRDTDRWERVQIPGELPTGCITGLARVEDCHPATKRTSCVNGCGELVQGVDRVWYCDPCGWSAPELVCCAPWGQLVHYGHTQRRAHHIVVSRAFALDEPVDARGNHIVPWSAPGSVTDQVLTRLVVQAAPAGQYV